MSANGDYKDVAVLINSTVIVLATVMKVPQIANVLRNGTTKGISTVSLFMEFWCFTNLFAYPCSKGYPLSNFMEFALLSIQDAILIFLVWRESKQLTITNLSAFVLYLSFVAGLSLGYFPPSVNYFIITTVTPMSAGGKLLQLLTITKARSAGSVSPATWAIGTYTAGAKFCTNYLTIYDVVLMVTSGQAALLNFAICVAALVYKTPTTPQEEKKKIK